MKKVVLKTYNITKKYGEQLAVDNVNMTIKKGDIYGFIGQNGAGKTTLIRLITGLIHKSSGEIELLGVNEENELNKARTMVGSLIESPSLYTNMTARENLEVSRLVRNIPGKKCIDEVLELVGLKDVEKKKVKNFSLGMRQRLGIANALMGNPKLLILDEPIDGLDPVARKLVWKYIIDDVAQRNLTVLISSHNLKELEGIVDHVGILYKGKIMKEFDLEYIQTHIHKIQVSFGDEEVNLDALNIAYQEERGSVKILIIEDSLSHIRKVIGEKAPLIFDILPLSLEELFMYEVGGEDDDIQKLIF